MKFAYLYDGTWYNLPVTRENWQDITQRINKPTSFCVFIPISDYTVTGFNGEGSWDENNTDIPKMRVVGHESTVAAINADIDAVTILFNGHVESWQFNEHQLIITLEEAGSILEKSIMNIDSNIKTADYGVFYDVDDDEVSLFVDPVPAANTHAGSGLRIKANNDERTIAPYFGWLHNPASGTTETLRSDFRHLLTDDINSLGMTWTSSTSKSPNGYCQTAVGWHLPKRITSVIVFTLKCYVYVEGDPNTALIYTSKGQGLTNTYLTSFSAGGYQTVYEIVIRMTPDELNARKGTDDMMYLVLESPVETLDGAFGTYRCRADIRYATATIEESDDDDVILTIDSHTGNVYTMENTVEAVSPSTDSTQIAPALNIIATYPNATGATTYSDMANFTSSAHANRIRLRQHAIMPDGTFDTYKKHTNAFAANIMTDVGDRVHGRFVCDFATLADSHSVKMSFGSATTKFLVVQGYESTRRAFAFTGLVSHAIVEGTTYEFEFVKGVGNSITYRIGTDTGSDSYAHLVDMSEMYLEIQVINNSPIQDIPAGSYCNFEIYYSKANTHDTVDLLYDDSEFVEDVLSTIDDTIDDITTPAAGSVTYRETLFKNTSSELDDIRDRNAWYSRLTRSTTVGKPDLEFREIDVSTTNPRRVITEHTIDKARGITSSYHPDNLPSAVIVKSTEGHAIWNGADSTFPASQVRPPIVINRPDIPPAFLLDVAKALYNQMAFNPDVSVQLLFDNNTVGDVISLCVKPFRDYMEKVAHNESMAGKVTRAGTWSITNEDAARKAFKVGTGNGYVRIEKMTTTGNMNVRCLAPSAAPYYGEYMYCEIFIHHNSTSPNHWGPYLGQDVDMANTRIRIYRNHAGNLFSGARILRDADDNYIPVPVRSWHSILVQIRDATTHRIWFNGERCYYLGSDVIDNTSAWTAQPRAFIFPTDTAEMPIQFCRALWMSWINHKGVIKSLTHASNGDITAEIGQAGEVRSIEELIGDAVRRQRDET